MGKNEKYILAHSRLINEIVGTLGEGGIKRDRVLFFENPLHLTGLLGELAKYGAIISAVFLAPGDTDIINEALEVKEYSVEGMKNKPQLFLCMIGSPQQVAMELNIPRTDFVKIDWNVVLSHELLGNHLKELLK